MTVGFEPAIQLLINGIILGSLYGLVGLGLSLVYGVMKVVNTAHGALFMMGGYIAFTFSSLVLRLPATAGVAISVIVVFLLGIGIELLAVERSKADPNSSMLLTLGVAILLEQIAILTWGGVYKFVPPIIGGTIQLATYYVQTQQVLGALAAVAIAIG